MSGSLTILFSAVAGFGMGLFYFGGLWLTLGALFCRRRSALIAIVSFFLRTGLVVAGLYLLSDVAGLTGLLSGLAGLVIARMFLVRRLPVRPRREI